MKASNAHIIVDNSETFFSGEQLTTMLNRFGHCDTYRFTRELVTAIAKALEKCTSVLFSEILLHPFGPSLFHSEIDNFDVFLSTLEGQSSVYIAHRIMLQEIGGQQDGERVLQLPSVPRTREQTLEISEEVQPECYVAMRKSPAYPCTSTSISSGPDARDKAARFCGF